MPRGVYLHRVKPLEKRFSGKWVEDESGCWLWTGGKYAAGYGSIKRGPRERADTAHRVSWEIHVGPIPPGAFVLHRCDVPACINPAHLYLGTQRDNMRDVAVRGRGTKKLDADAVRAIRASTNSTNEIAAAYGVHPSTVTGIRSGALRSYVS